MSGLVVPSTGPNRHGRTPTVHEYVRSYLTRMRAPLRESTMFTPAGRTVVHRQGERVIYAPDGTAIRVLELPGPDGFGGNQVEHGDHLHAHVRPQVTTLTGAVHEPRPRDPRRRIAIPRRRTR